MLCQLSVNELMWVHGLGVWRSLNVHEKMNKIMVAEVFGEVKLDLSKQHTRVGGGWVRISIMYFRANSRGGTLGGGGIHGEL